MLLRIAKIMKEDGKNIRFRWLTEKFETIVKLLYIVHCSGNLCHPHFQHAHAHIQIKCKVANKVGCIEENMTLAELYRFFVETF